MKPFSIQSSELFKVQAQRLRESLQRSNIQLSHSQGLESISHLHGFRDWNTAASKVKSERSFYIVYCEFSKPGDNKMGFFQYLVRAQSPDEVTTICQQEFQTFLKKGDAFDHGTHIYVTNILEVNDLNASALINWMSVRTEDDSQSTIGHMLPFGDSGNKLKIYQCHHESESGDEGSPFITLS